MIFAILWIVLIIFYLSIGTAILYCIGHKELLWFKYKDETKVKLFFIIFVNYASIIFGWLFIATWILGVFCYRKITTGSIESM